MYSNRLNIWDGIIVLATMVTCGVSILHCDQEIRGRKYLPTVTELPPEDWQTCVNLNPGIDEDECPLRGAP